MGEISLTGLRILHVHTLPLVSGSGINTFLTMRASRDSGARVGLACAPGGRLEELVQAQHMDFYPIRHFVSELAPLKDLHAFWQLDRLLARNHFDVVHTHNSKAGFLGRLTARRHHVPVIIHTVHGFAFHEKENWIFRRLFVWLERLGARWCDQLIAISQPMIDWALREKVASREKLIKIYSGIEIDRFKDRASNQRLREQFGIQESQIVIGLVSKLWEGKGHEVLLEAMARLKERDHAFKLLIVGDGYLGPKLRKKVTALKLENEVIFTGFRSDVPEITALLDISVLPSFFEGMGRVVLEAMAAGKPVVASHVGGLTELVEDGITGYLVPPGNVEVLADRVERLIQQPELRMKMGREGSERITHEFSADVMVEKIHEVYDRCLASTSRSGHDRRPLNVRSPQADAQSVDVDEASGLRKSRE